MPENSDALAPEEIAAYAADTASVVEIGRQGLLDCLLLLARVHGAPITRDAALAGLPVEGSELTPRCSSVRRSALAWRRASCVRRGES